MINKNDNTIAGIPRNCFKRLAKIGLEKSTNRVKLIRECTHFSTIRIEVFVTEYESQESKIFLLFLDDSNDYLAFSSFNTLLEYVMLNYAL